LPTGQAMLSISLSNDLEIYTPAGGPQPGWRPHITHVPRHLHPGRIYRHPVEVALSRVWAAEKQLQAARRAASKAFEEVGRGTSSGMFAESAFVPRRTAEKWVEEAKAPKPPESEWLREKRERAERGPAPKTRAQGEGIGLAADLDQERADDRERQRHFEQVHL
jgi:hypothetical protein